MREIIINTPLIKLDSALKFSALCSSGGEAKQLIADGLVTVNEEPCLQRGRKLYPGDTITFGMETLKIVSSNDHS